ncbi:hypothetical protein C8J57DRAFT_1227684 [Mycena rebaudengoi]|nr:hypothetical protein C8J57DRAFT_1227684 [Mycena rebaudengoi]
MRCHNPLNSRPPDPLLGAAGLELERLIDPAHYNLASTNELKTLTAASTDCPLHVQLQICEYSVIAMETISTRSYSGSSPRTSLCSVCFIFTFDAPLVVEHYCRLHSVSIVSASASYPSRKCSCIKINGFTWRYGFSFFKHPQSRNTPSSSLLWLPVNFGFANFVHYALCYLRHDMNYEFTGLVNLIAPPSGHTWFLRGIFCLVSDLQEVNGYYLHFGHNEKLQMQASGRSGITSGGDIRRAEFQIGGTPICAEEHTIGQYRLSRTWMPKMGSNKDKVNHFRHPVCSVVFVLDHIWTNFCDLNSNWIPGDL